MALSRPFKEDRLELPLPTPLSFLWLLFTGNSAILQLTKGDEVSVTCVDGYYSELYGMSDEVYATFSGYLISPVFQEFIVG